MALSTQPYKGARDFYPSDKRLLKYIFGVWREICERFGYEEYDGPLLEPLDLYTAKTGDEIVNEQTYRFTDRGDREVVIRPEMTPTVSRMVAARRQELPYPLRLYSIPNLWRYERPQKGRLREHWQLNVDLFGVAGYPGDLEMIQVSDAIMQRFGAKRDMYCIKVNSRTFMDMLLREHLGLNEVQAITLSKLIDRMHKIDHGEFVAQADAIFSPSERDAGGSDNLLQILNAKNFEELPDELNNHASLNDVKNLLTNLHAQGVDNAVFDITLMRGFDYYTDIVFEVFDTNPDNARAMFGGGRYDGLVGLFGVEPVPTVGFGMGDVVLQDFLLTHDLAPKLKPETDLYVILIGDVFEPAQKILHDLRGMGINVFLDSSDRKIDNKIKTALKKELAFVLFIGQKELDNGQFTLKNLRDNSEEAHSIERIVSIVKDHRKSKP